MKHLVKTGTTDYTTLVKMRDDAGAPATGLTEASIDIAYARVETDNDVTTTDVTPAALTALTDAHTDWGFEEVSATDHPGVYRLDIADAVFATGAWSAVVSVTGTGLDPADLEFQLVAIDILDSDRLGLVSLSDIESSLVIVKSDTTAVHSDTTHIHSDTTAIHTQTTTIASDVVQIYSDTTEIVTGVSDTESALVKVYSDTTLIETRSTTILSDVAAIEVGVSDTESALVKVYSDTTHIESDAVAIEVGVSDTESALVKVYSDTTAIEAGGGSLTAPQSSKLTQIHSDLIVASSDLLQVYSDTTHIHSDTTVIEAGGGSLTAPQASKLTQIHSDLIVASSDLLQVYSDTTHIHSDTTAIHLQTTTIASDIVQVYSDTSLIVTGVSDTESALVKVYSDTTQISADVVTEWIWLDPDNGTAGGTGSLGDPVDSITAAYALGTRIKFVPGDGSSYAMPVIDFNAGLVLDLNSWRVTSAGNATFSGNQERIFSSSPGGRLIATGGTITFGSAPELSDISIEATTFTCKYGYFKNCLFDVGTISFATHNFAVRTDFYNCIFDDITFAAAGAYGGGIGTNGHIFNLVGCYGGITLTGLKNSGTADGQLFIHLGWGPLSTDGTAGTVQHTSHVEIDDQSAGAITFDLVSQDAATVSQLTQIQSDLVQVYSDTSLIVTGVSDTESALVKVYSDTTLLETRSTTILSDVAAIEVGVSDTESALVKVYSDTSLVVTGVSDTESALVHVLSDTTAIHLQTTTIASDVVHVHSDTTAIHTLATTIASDVVEIRSDTTHIESDAALLDAAHAEPTGVPAANESPLDKLAYLFMGLRNQVDVTATKKKFYDDGGAVEWEKDLSDDGNTFSEGEANAP